MSEPLDLEAKRQLGHDTRKPLASLISTAHVLLLGLDGELSEQARTDIERIKRNAEQALKVIDNLLEILEDQN